VLVNGVPTKGLKGLKALALLAYLVLEIDRPHRRDALAVFFWPDQPRAQGLQNLRQTLSRLRRALQDREAPVPHLLTERQTIRFNPQSDYWLDVVAFKDLVAGTKHHPHRRLDVCSTCLSRLATAAEIFRGELLAHLHPSGSPTFDEWLLLEREHLNKKACTILQTLARSHLARCDYDDAARYARRLLQLDPWNEWAHRLLLRALALGEGRTAALHHHQAFRQALAAELGIEQEDRTQVLVAQIEAGELVHTLPGSRLVGLPAPATHFVGRQAELQQMYEYLASRDQRLITLYGHGGCGKTRLAVQVAAEQTPLWRDGIWYVALARVPSSEALVAALATALGLQTGEHSPEQRALRDFLQPKELLLILDGFEHLMAGASLLQNLLNWAAELRILVTSRARLGLHAESAIRVTGLELPARKPVTVVKAETSSAVQLFVQSARRVEPAFRLTAENLPHVTRICRLVDGLPLGIELAAVWVRLYPCWQIADAMEESLDFLERPGINHPQRHSSLRATFEYSYGLLSEPEQLMLRKLSVFQGGFTVEAAQHVAGAGPHALYALLDRSLLQASSFDDTQDRSSRRLELHLTLQQYASEKLSEEPGEEAATRAEHSRFYLALLREWGQVATAEPSKEALDQIQEEMGNVRAAWHWAVADARIEELATSLPALAQFYGHSGLLPDAEVVFGQAAERLATLSDMDADGQDLIGQLLVEQATFLRRQARYPQAIQVAQAAISWARSSQAALCEARARSVWGEALWRQGEHEVARSQLEGALSKARLLDEGSKVEADILNSLAGICWQQGDHAKAREYLERCLDLTAHSESGRRTNRILNNLGVVAVEQADYAAAMRFYWQALSLQRESGNREGESICLANLGNLNLYLGAYAEAERYYLQALAIQRETGARQHEAKTLGNLACLALNRGDDEKARQYARDGLHMAQEIDERSLQATMWMHLGDALRLQERLDEAVGAYRRSLALRRELGQANLATEPLAGLARVCLKVGDLAEGQAHVEEILNHLESGGTLHGVISPFRVHLTCHQVLAVSKDFRAEKVLNTAHTLLQERAAKIADETLRHSFLENVAAHRELVQEFERMRDGE
jgi:predicted ATPase/DNA-binding SARP family transcriptional activator